MRIASLLPSATEIAFAIGLGDQVVGVTHECDYPAAARGLPVLTRSLLPAGLNSADIDAAVAAGHRDAHTLYALDAELLAGLAPDLVLTQSLCEVCAVPRSQVDEVICTMPAAARVVSQDPSSIWDMLADIERLGLETGREQQAHDVVRRAQARIEAVRSLTADVPRPRVFCAEWMEPIFCAGHWLPEMVSLAGGMEGLGRPGVDSGHIDWDEVQAYQPEVVLLMPCGFDAEGAVREAAFMAQRPGWPELPAVKAGRVFVVDADAYFVRPGPRLVDGVEIMARLLQPQLFDAPLQEGIAYRLAPGSTDRFQPFV